MHIDDTLPGTDDREFLAGMNGTGKTTFIMKQLVQLRKRDKNTIFIIIDSGKQWESQKIIGEDRVFWKRIYKYEKDVPIEISSKTNLKALTTEHIYVYRPKGKAMYDTFIPKLFQWIFEVGQVCLVIDEGSEFCNGPNVVQDDLEKLIKQGRKKHVMLLIGSQRPSGVPTIYMSEAKIVVVFYLQNIKDRQKVAEWIHEDFYEKVSGHNFRIWKRSEPEKTMLIIQEQGDKKDNAR